MEMRARFSKDIPGICLVEVEGALLGGDEIDQLRGVITQAVDAGCGKLVIDFTGVSHMNSAAVGVLVSAVTSYARRHWQVRLCGVSKPVYNVLAITKLNLVFEMTKTREDAIKSLQ